MREYGAEDFETYSRLFQEEAGRVSSLMQILDNEIKFHLDMPVMRPKDLFRMAMDISYNVDKEYKKEKGIEDEPFSVSSFFLKEDVLSEMQTLLKQELQRYLGQSNDGAE